MTILIKRDKIQFVNEKTKTLESTFTQLFANINVTEDTENYRFL